MTTKEAAQHLGLSPRTLERYRVTGEGPQFVKYERLVYYRVSDLDEWQESRIRCSTSDPGPTTKKKPVRKKGTTIRKKGTTVRNKSDRTGGGSDSRDATDSDTGSEEE